MEGCGIASWLGMALMSAASFLVFLALLLAIAALGRHLFFGSHKS